MLDLWFLLNLSCPHTSILQDIISIHDKQPVSTVLAKIRSSIDSLISKRDMSSTFTLVRTTFVFGTRRLFLILFLNLVIELACCLVSYFQNVCSIIDAECGLPRFNGNGGIQLNGSPKTFFVFLCHHSSPFFLLSNKIIQWHDPTSDLQDIIPIHDKRPISISLVTIRTTIDFGMSKRDISITIPVVRSTSAF